MNRTVPEVAEFLRCSADVVYELIKSGQLTASRVGRGRGRYLVTPASLDAYLAKTVVRPAPTGPGNQPRRARRGRAA